MPIITEYNPWEAGLNAAGDYVAAQQKRKDETSAAQGEAEKAAQTQLLENKKFEYKKSEDAKTDAIAQSQEDRAGAAATDAHASAVAELRIKQDQDNVDRQLAPLKVKLETANVALAKGRIPLEKANAQRAQAQATLDNLNAMLKAKYGAATAQAMLAKADAERIRALAGASHENMETAEGAQRLASGKDTYHPRDAGGLAGGTDLGDAGAALYKRIVETPNINMQTGIGMVNGSGLTPKQKVAVMKELNMAGLETNRTILSDSRHDAQLQINANTSADLAKSKDVKSFLYTLQQPGSKYMDLPLPLRVKFQEQVSKSGLHGTDAINAVSQIASGKFKNPPLTPAEATALTNAFNGQ